MRSAEPCMPWKACAAGAPLHLTMTFVGDTLVLGAGTPLAVADRRVFLTKQDTHAFDEARVAALLALACGRIISPAELRYVHEALKRQSEGDTTLALMHLALGNLPKLQPPDEGARRLSSACGLLKGGTSPAELLSALGIDSASSESVDRAYNPDQPRVPVGNGTPKRAMDQRWRGDLRPTGAQGCTGR